MWSACMEEKATVSSFRFAGLRRLSSPSLARGFVSDGLAFNTVDTVAQALNVNTGWVRLHRSTWEALCQQERNHGIDMPSKARIDSPTTVSF